MLHIVIASIIIIIIIFIVRIFARIAKLFQVHVIGRRFVFFLDLHTPAFRTRYKWRRCDRLALIQRVDLLLLFSSDNFTHFATEFQILLLFLTLLLRQISFDFSTQFGLDILDTWCFDFTFLTATFRLLLFNFFHSRFLGRFLGWFLGWFFRRFLSRFFDSLLDFFLL